MERVRFTFLALAVLLVSTGNILCKDQPVNGLNEFSLFEKNGKVGLMDEAGKVLIPAEYDAIGWSNGNLTILDRVVGYRIEGRWGLITTSNKVVTPPEFLELKPGEGSLLIAQKKSALSQRHAYGVINTSGKTIIPFVYDALSLTNMRAIVMSRTGTRYLFGLTDLSHNILIPVKYQALYSLGSLRYAVENFDNKTAIFSDEGNQVTPFDIDSISPFRKDYAIIYRDQKQGLIGRNGQLILKPSYGEIRVEDDATILARQPHQLYLLRGDNTLIRRFDADEVRAISAGHYAIYTAGKLQLTDNNFTPLRDEYFSSVSRFENGMAVYRKNSRAGVISSDGKVLIPAEYHAIEIDGSNGFRACLDTGGKNRWVVLNPAGKTITEKQYEYIGPFNGKYYPVKSRGYWGALNATGREIITCVHDSLIQELNGNLVVRFKGKYGVISLEEHWRVTPQPNALELLDENNYLEFDSETTYLKSLKGGLIYFSANPLEYDRGYIRESLPSGAYWIIDMSGIVIDRSNQPLQADKIFLASEGLRAIRKDGKFGFIDDEGRLRIANRYELVQPFSDGLAAIQIRGKWGFIDRHENLVIQPVYDEVQNFNNGMTIVRQGPYKGLIDMNGRVVLPLRYDDVIPNEHERFVVRAETSYGLVNSSGAIVIHPKYDRIVDTGKGYVIVERNGKSGVLTLQGVSTIPMIYDGLSFDRQGDQFFALKESQLEVIKKNEE